MILILKTYTFHLKVVECQEFYEENNTMFEEHEVLIMLVRIIL